MKNIAVVLSGCGFLDGAEINESVLTLLAIDKQNAKYQCFAPNKPQVHVVNHLKGEVAENQERNCLEESARIARQDVLALSALNSDDYDAIIFPGGFGVAKNLCDFAFKGKDMTLDDEVVRVMTAFKDTNKPAGYICIAPVLIAKIYDAGTSCTIGNDPEIASAIEAMGAKHVNCDVRECIVDKAKKVVSTPAYMLANRISESAEGIEKLVKAVISMS